MQCVHRRHPTAGAPSTSSASCITPSILMCGGWRRRCHAARLPHKRCHKAIVRAKSDEEPNWEEEMDIFKKRTMRPNQLATLRELESKVSVGKVLWSKDGLAILTGINPDAPLGTKLAFVSGGTGVLLWHRSDNLAFALVLGGAASISTGEGVECKIKGVLQVIDEVKGPITKKDYELWQAPAGDALCGRVVDFLGRPWGGDANEVLGLDRTKPLLNQQVAMKNREQITECLLTGVKALDVLTPLGRGASLLVVGPNGSGKSTLALDAIISQAGTGVKCILSSTSRSQEELQQLVQTLEAANAMSHVSIVAALPSACNGERYAAVSAACAVGERVRDEGGHALVLLDDLAPLLQVWEELVLSLAAALGREKMREGLIKDESGRDVALNPRTEQELVDYEGMLVSGAVAQRRGFFSTLFLRAAKLHKSFGGGSMTLLPLVPGRPATGIKVRAPDMSKYQTLSEDQKQRMRAALVDRARLETAAAAPAEGEVSTEAVEEFISISDGQVVLESRTSLSAPYAINPKLSITRIGSRAYPKALEALAPQIRLDLAQAEDARRYGGAVNDPNLRKAEVHSQRLAAALKQQAGHPASLEEQVAVLFALQRGYADSVPPEDVPHWVARALAHVRGAAPDAMAEIASTRQLTAKAERGLEVALAAFVRQQA